MKWPKSEEKLNFGGRWVLGAHESVPQAKFRGGTLVKGLISGSAQRVSSRAQHRGSHLGFSTVGLISGSAQRVETLGLNTEGLLSDSP